MLGLVIHVNIDNDGRGDDNYDTSVIPLNTDNMEEARKAMKEYAENTKVFYSEFHDGEVVRFHTKPYLDHEPENSCIISCRNLWTKLCIATLYSE